ncbi:helix-turn-helix transcriptional regulator [Amycolatopsis sp. NPDC021455]|uniref:helix-turn-helix domain-containing protein n=1 Tax=Amycolatopsis sp. NPDC021455 TaxID=3154901 RepID=UPI0033FFA083
MSSAKPRPALARRLRALREDAGITQAQLAQALGEGKPLSISLISSWENTEKPVTPPVHRLNAYATLFASPLKMNGDVVLPVGQLTDVEQVRRKDLLDELLWLRDEREFTAPLPAQTDFWQFGEDEDITIVCAQLPEEYRRNLTYADPENADYVLLYTYADPDALIELFGHIRSRNPDNHVKFLTVGELKADDYTAHLVLLGGVDWNTVTRNVIDRAKLPVQQVAREDEAEHGGFRVEQGGHSRLFAPRLDADGHLLEDVAHFYRSVSPFNRERTVTVCNGMYGRGTLGAVRALTDARFRDRNWEYLQGRFGDAKTFSVISRVPVVGGQGLTPDWTVEENRLHEWPEAGA